MSEKPQAGPWEKQEDLLEQIFIQGLNKMDAPAQTMTEEDASAEETHPDPQRENGAEAGPPANRKSKYSAVYLYLLILFGAALLMLLLAYFVQQRSSENAIDSMNFSRDELLAQIKALEEKNEALSVNLSVLQRRLDAQKQSSDDLLNQILDTTQAKLYSWKLFWELERFYQARDFEACAALLILRDQGEYSYRTPDEALEREDEIIPAVIDAGYLKGDFHLHPEDYTDLVEAFMSRYNVPGYVSRETSSAQAP